MSTPETPHVGIFDALRRFLGVPLRPQTYRNLGYLLLAFPLGVAYFVVVTTGLSMGVGLLVTLLGIPIVVFTLVAAKLLADFEANLVAWLLDVDIDPREDRQSRNTEFTLEWPDIWTRFKEFVASPRTWTSLLLVLLKFVFGVIAFVAVVTYGAVVASMLSAPFIYDLPTIHYLVGPIVIDTAREALSVAAGGVVVAFIGLHVLNGLARLFGVATVTLLEFGNNANGQLASGDSYE